jgi:hypothetical protein
LLTWTYRLTFSGDAVSLQALDGGSLPALGFDGSAPTSGTVSGSAATWTVASRPATLAIAWNNLDPRNLEDARASVQASLPGGLSIATPFIPTVPVAVTGASAAPSAWFENALDLGTFPQSQLGNRLQSALFQLLSVTPLGADQRGLRVEAELFVNLGGGAEMSIPLLLVPTLLFQLPGVTVDGVGVGQVLAQALVAARADLTGRLHLRMAWLGGAEDRPRALFGMDVNGVVTAG